MIGSVINSKFSAGFPAKHILYTMVFRFATSIFEKMAKNSENLMKSAVMLNLSPGVLRSVGAGLCARPQSLYPTFPVVLMPHGHFLSFMQKRKEAKKLLKGEIFDISP